MSLYLRMVIGPVIVCDIELFSAVKTKPADDDPPPQLAGGQGGVYYPDPPAAPHAFGFSQ